jgi:3-deoxy-D-manno-octulosonic-acid transferase
MFIVNGRISDKTAPTYRKLRFWFGPVLRLFKLILVQSDLDGSRFISAGANPETIQVTGSFKFDVAKRNEVKEAMWKELLEKSAFNAPQMILLGASTWDGEEALLLDTYKALSQKYPNLRLILVPRHFERREVVEKEISARGLNSVRKSDLDSGAYKVKPLTDRDVILADTTGEIMGLFPFAAVTVVGRTFRSQGGQNMIEPCLVGVPTIVGPETQNFRPVMADLLASKAIIQLSKDEELIPELDRLLGDETARKELGTTASNAVLARRGVVNHCVNAVKSVIFR